MILCKTRSDLKYLLDSLFYLAQSQAPYIHVMLSYVVSITWYIIQPLVRLLLHITNPQLVWYHLHRYKLCNDLIQFLAVMFSFKSEYISPYSVSTVTTCQVNASISGHWHIAASGKHLVGNGTKRLLQCTEYMSATYIGWHQNGNMVVLKKPLVLEGCCICMHLYVTGLIQHQTVKKVNSILWYTLSKYNINIQAFCVISAKSR